MCRWFDSAPGHHFYPCKNRVFFCLDLDLLRWQFRLSIFARSGKVVLRYVNQGCLGRFEFAAHTAWKDDHASVASRGGYSILMTTSLQPVSVVVVNHNAGGLLLECVEVALSQAQEVIVVDNQSTDASMEFLAARFPDQDHLKLVYLKENLGFAAGCNVGIASATHSHLLFINPDTILGPLSLGKLVQVIDGDASVGMVGGLLTNLDGSEQGGGRRAVPTPWRSFVRAFGLNRMSGWWPTVFFDFYLHKQPLPNEPIEVEAISGALMLVSRVALDDVGLWDEAYFLHCEDLDWCMRFRQKGWRILFVPDAPVIHYQGHSSRARPMFVEWHKHKGMVRFYRKFFSHQYPGVLMGLVGVAVWVRFSALLLGHWIKVVANGIKGRGG